jgi:hypothetical protein
MIREVIESCCIFEMQSESQRLLLPFVDLE